MNTFSVLKYPNNVLFNFENRSTGNDSSFNNLLLVNETVGDAGAQWYFRFFFFSLSKKVLSGSKYPKKYFISFGKQQHCWCCWWALGSPGSAGQTPAKSSQDSLWLCFLSQTRRFVRSKFVSFLPCFPLHSQACCSWAVWFLFATLPMKQPGVSFFRNLVPFCHDLQCTVPTSFDTICSYFFRSQHYIISVPGCSGPITNPCEVKIIIFWRNGCFGLKENAGRHEGSLFKWNCLSVSVAG